MLEIILLIFLTRRIGVLAERKGLKAGWWKFYTVLAWIGGEIIGIVLAITLFNEGELFPILLLAIGGAATGYFIVRNTLTKKPDAIEDDINQIGDDIKF